MNERGEELRELQSRAYGRQPDISEDPAAQDRLAMLQTTRPDPDVVRPPFARSSTENADPVASAMEADPQLLPREQIPETWLARAASLFAPTPSVPWILVASACLVLVTIATACITASIVRPRSAETVAVISANWDASWPVAFGDPKEGAVIFDEFHGLTLFRSTDWQQSNDPNEQCLLAVTTEALAENPNAPGFSPVRIGCSAGAFPASFTLLLDEVAPEDLRSAFPAGTALKFTMMGDLVEVVASR